MVVINFGFSKSIEMGKIGILFVGSREGNSVNLIYFIQETRLLATRVNSFNKELTFFLYLINTEHWLWNQFEETF